MCLYLLLYEIIQSKFPALSALSLKNFLAISPLQMYLPYHRQFRSIVVHAARHKRFKSGAYAFIINYKTKHTYCITYNVSIE